MTRRAARDEPPHAALKRPLFLCLLFLLLLCGSSAPVVAPLGAAGSQSGSRNTWSARSAAGLTLAGTWTAVADPRTGAVTGTWTLVDANGATVMAGGWSAAKAPTGWAGAWRANVSGRGAEYSGTWSAAVGLKANARFADLFAHAAQTVVSGTWRAGRQSGSWSIRAYD